MESTATKPRAIRPLLKPAAGRVPPHSVEAEEQLLSVCLLDGGEALARAEESGVEPASFYVPANRIIYERLLAMVTTGKPIELAVLAEELKAARQLDEIGGYAYLTRVADRVATTAGLSFFIKKVRELALLRSLITTATGAVENCYNYTGPEDLDKILAPLREAGTHADLSATSLLHARAFDLRAQPPRPKLRVWLGDSHICTSGNLSSLIAQAKAGKSTTVGAILAALMASALGDDYAAARQTACLGFRAANPEGHAVIHIDTEQSRFDADSLIRRALKRAAMTEPPAWLLSYQLAGLQPPVLRELLKHIIRRARARFGGIAIVIIDGVADLVLDVNNPDECNPLIADLHGIAIENEAPVLNIIHENPQGPRQKDKSKARGHLGSQLERKCESNIWIQKGPDGVSILWSDRMRGAPIPIHLGPAFAWSEEEKCHALVENPHAEGLAQTRADRLSKLRDTLAKSWPVNAAHLSSADLADAIARGERCGERKARQLLKSMLEEGLIQKRDPANSHSPYVRP